MVQPDLTVLVATYEPDLHKLECTLASILIQTGIRICIIISDDGSRDMHCEEIKAYFQKHNFSDYRILTHEKNQGTVKNVISGMVECKTKYVKLISPGDMIYGEDTLAGWLQETEKCDAEMSFGDFIAYHMEKENFHAIAREASPVNASEYTGEEPVPDYFLYDDIAYAPAIMVKRDAFLKYLRMMEGKVIYCEDAAYRIMSYCGARFYYYPRDVVLYEVGAGISTNGDSDWDKRLQHDMREAYKIMWSLPCYVPEWREKHQKYRSLEPVKHAGVSFHMWKYLCYPKYVHRKIRKMIRKKRYTTTDVNLGYLRDIGLVE